jgi:hypothetical protein
MLSVGRYRSRFGLSTVPALVVQQLDPYDVVPLWRFTVIAAGIGWLAVAVYLGRDLNENRDNREASSDGDNR